jgi:hypothetical protein
MLNTAVADVTLSEPAAANTDWFTIGLISGTIVNSVNGNTGVVVLDTDDIDEGVTNLYFTGARAITAIQGDASWNAADWDAAFTATDTATSAATADTLMLRDVNGRVKAAYGVASDDVATVGQLSSSTGKSYEIMTGGGSLTVNARSLITDTDTYTLTNAGLTTGDNITVTRFDDAVITSAADIENEGEVISQPLTLDLNIEYIFIWDGSQWRL